MRAVIEKTINHNGGGHVISQIHEDCTKSDVVDELGVKVKNCFMFTLNWPVHG
jgi:hypothetical protein